MFTLSRISSTATGHSELVQSGNLTAQLMECHHVMVDTPVPSCCGVREECLYGGYRRHSSEHPTGRNGVCTMTWYRRVLEWIAVSCLSSSGVHQRCTHLSRGHDRLPHPLSTSGIVRERTPLRAVLRTCSRSGSLSHYIMARSWASGSGTECPLPLCPTLP